MVKSQCYLCFGVKRFQIFHLYWTATCVPCYFWYLDGNFLYPICTLICAFKILHTFSWSILLLFVGSNTTDHLCTFKKIYHLYTPLQIAHCQSVFLFWSFHSLWICHETFFHFQSLFWECKKKKNGYFSINLELYDQHKLSIKWYWFCRWIIILPESKIPWKSKTDYLPWLKGSP